MVDKKTYMAVDTVNRPLTFNKEINNTKSLSYGISDNLKFKRTIIGLLAFQMFKYKFKLDPGTPLIQLSLYIYSFFLFLFYLFFSFLNWIGIK